MADTGLRAAPGACLKGRARVPGDKSVSHRALLMGALAEGETIIEGLLEGDDVLATARAMRAFGARVDTAPPGLWRVAGRGRLSEPGEVIDCGNAGTSARLIMGAAAGFPLAASFTGDDSLRERPMDRVLAPLALMGARWIGRAGGRLPLTLEGGRLCGITYAPPQTSAQVKSAVLLAGLHAAGETRVIEAAPTRDHTERMLRAFGVRVDVEEGGGGRVVRLQGGQKLTPARIRVPGDPSSAAFPLVGALVTEGSEVTVEGVLLNPLRIGLFETLIEMGADLSIANRRDEAGEAVGDVTARSSRLHGVTVPPWRSPAMIDEYPILAVAAAFATGPTVMRGVGELRIKETDRIAAMAAGLAACGVQVEEESEGLVVAGLGRANRRVAGGALAHTGGDHRIAMAFLVLGMAAQAPVSIDAARMIATSFPGFAELMTALGARIDAG
ncbi:MAG TPA: 3-phosphoshikimate 1-carboxyvinyltransferase [Caulobacteraceae bacterium]